MGIAKLAKLGKFQSALMNALVLAREVIGMLAVRAFQFDHVVLGHTSKSKILNHKSKIKRF